MSVKAMQWAKQLTVGKSSYKAVLIALCDIHHAENNTCFASISDLVSFTELNWKTINCAIDALAENDFLTVIKRPGNASKFVLHLEKTPSKIGGTRSGNKHNLRVSTPSKSGGADETPPPSKNGETPSKSGAGTTPSKNGDDPLQKRNLPPPNLEDKRDNGINGIKKISSKVENLEDEIYQKFARAMWDRISLITKSAKSPNLNSWARDIRLLVETDKRDIKTAWRVFAWAHADHFWRKNILSAAKFRKQFDTLFVQHQEAGHANPRASAKPNQPTKSERLRDETYYGAF